VIRRSWSVTPCPGQLKRLARFGSTSTNLVKIKFMISAAVVEAIALMPLAVSGMGHAGPNGVLAWVSLLLNLPGFAVLTWLISRFDLDFSWSYAVAVVFVSQTAIIWLFALFVWYLKRRFKPTT
jgi:hypothetical protein